jgi:hypothetical protein
MAKQLIGGAGKPQPSSTVAVELIWLLGQPSLGDYLEFVATKVIGGESRDPRELVAEWRAANDLYHRLEQDEAGLADAVACTPLPKALRKRAAAVERLPWFRSSFDNLPYEIVEVELDKLIVSQSHVERGATSALVEALGSDALPKAVFDLCLPRERALPQIEVQRLASGRYRFSSPSTDFRAHAPRLTLNSSGADQGVEGPLFATMSIDLGFGSNMLSGIRSGTRVLLQNGYHRAYALRSLGYRTAFAVVEDVTRKDELRLTATDDVADDPEFFFAARRPPLLKDFFDPRLAKPLPARAIYSEIEVEIVVKSHNATRL